MGPELTLRDFQIGWICAVQTEYVVACALLDEEFEHLLPAIPHDNNAYTFGRVAQHYVVIACLPKGKYGLTSATSVAKDMLHGFPSIRFAFMVGIGGGAPSQKNDIRLGDVVVSTPTGRSGGVIQYNFGKAIQGKQFERTGSLNSPPTAVLTACNKLAALHERKGSRIRAIVQDMITAYPRLREKYQRPPTETDILFKSSFVHIENTQSCLSACARHTDQIQTRSPRAEMEEADCIVHYGLIASADQLMKDAVLRDRYADEENILCFEMEAAGLMDVLPCLVIRGICDYSDTHKNDIWQSYAAAAAAAYTKELLSLIPGRELAESKQLKVENCIFNNQGEVKNQAQVQYISGGMTFN